MIKEISYAMLSISYLQSKTLSGWKQWTILISLPHKIYDGFITCNLSAYLRYFICPWYFEGQWTYYHIYPLSYVSFDTSIERILCISYCPGIESISYTTSTNSRRKVENNNKKRYLEIAMRSMYANKPVNMFVSSYLINLSNEKS